MSSSERVDPPPYSVHSTGFPPGYFIIRSLATGKVLDVAERKKDDAFRDPSADNQARKKTSTTDQSEHIEHSSLQVFFVDYLGNLCSKHSGHGIDVEDDGRIVLRHRRPMTPRFPSRYSHPLPCFNYSPITGHITLAFAYDPAYPGSRHRESESSSEGWRNQTYILTAIPATKPRDLFDDAADFIVGAASVLTSPLAAVFSGKAPESNNTIADVQRQGLELREDELSEVDRAEETLDDSTDLARRVKVIALSAGSENDLNPNPQMSKRRQWEIVPLLINKAVTGAI